MDSEDKLETFIVIVIIVLDIIACLMIDLSYYFIPMVTANLLFILFYLIPKIKKYIDKQIIKKKAIFTEGQIYDIIKCYEMIYLSEGTESSEAREYPVIILQNDKGEWEKIIANESDPDEYKIGERINIWYKYGRKERVQISDNTFLKKNYRKINISEEEINKIDNTFLEDELTIYHINKNASFSEYNNTLIMSGKNLIIEKSKVINV